MSDHDPSLEEAETAAAASIEAHSPVSRSELLAQMVSATAAIPTPELMDFCAKALAFAQNPHQKPEGSSDEDNKATIAMKPSGASPEQAAMPVIQTVREDLDTVLAGQDLPADAVEKLLTLFEAAVTARVGVEMARVEDEHELALAEQADDLVEKLDDYLDYAAREFFAENEIAIENSLKVDLYEEFVDGLRKLFVEHWVEIPEDRVDVAAKLAERVADLEELLNDKTREVLGLEETLLAVAAKRVFEGATSGMTDADRSRMQQLTETVEFDGDEEALRRRLGTIREAHFKAGGTPAKKQPGVIAESEGEVITVSVSDDGEKTPILSEDPEVNLIAQSISRMAGRRL